MCAKNIDEMQRMKAMTQEMTQRGRFAEFGGNGGLFVDRSALMLIKFMKDAQMSKSFSQSEISM